MKVSDLPTSAFFAYSAALQRLESDQWLRDARNAQGAVRATCVRFARQCHRQSLKYMRLAVRCAS